MTTFAEIRDAYEQALGEQPPKRRRVSMGAAQSVFDLVGTKPRAQNGPPLRVVVGIDASLRGFGYGVAVPLFGSMPEPRAIEVVRVRTDSAGSVRERIARYRTLIAPVMRAVAATENANYDAPSLVLIEQYAYEPTQTAGSIDRAELGGMLRDRLVEAGCDVVEVAIGTLKVFGSAHGRASKEQMISDLARRYDRSFGSSDSADAFGLTELGICALGHRGVADKKRQQSVQIVASKIAEAARERVGAR